MFQYSVIKGEIMNMSKICSEEARGKVDAARLRSLTENEYLGCPEGATADEITAMMQARGENVNPFSIRPRVTELKSERYGAVLVETGKRRKNERGNSCAVLIHKTLAEWDNMEAEGADDLRKAEEADWMGQK